MLGNLSHYYRLSSGFLLAAEPLAFVSSLILNGLICEEDLEWLTTVLLACRASVKNSGKVGVLFYALI